ncbi:cell division protein FtsQ/DivIB [Oceanobacillus manasiensis]|uniref:cell division protein FtsQ/DivIB n=1 Tax=Oceanobacillus manasiensis TaxID=586413 RepID=UPI0005A88A84|nr:FtsQ-type POTRA domain-containing protein [Oceanobacillus manasiensis]
MSQKKIVSIEDRIPKLKQARKKKANRRLVFYLSIFFFLISIIAYLQSPLSDVKTITIKGNTFLSDNEIVEMSGLTTKTNIWSLNKKAILEDLTKNPIIDSVEVSRQLPRTVLIEVNELNRVGYIEQDSNYYPVLGTGTVLNTAGQESSNGDAPLLLDFKEEEYLHRMTAELEKLPTSILKLISEIYWVPTDENTNKILLYMNDGFLVDGTIRDFAEKMRVYPSIVSQLEEGSRGIIHIGVGAYFEAFNDSTEQEETEEGSEEAAE